MAEYGIEIRDASNNIVLDNRHLTQRLYYWGIHGENTTVTYAQPLAHEPTIVAMGINGWGAPVEHRTSAGQYIGFRVGTHPTTSVGNSLVMVFLRE